MKKLLIGIIAIILVISLVACTDTSTNTNEPVKEAPQTVKETEPTTEVPPTKSKEYIEELISLEYDALKYDYNYVLSNYSLEKFEEEEHFFQESGNINTSLVLHILRYKDAGAEVSFAQYDIDKNGIEELIVGANGAYGAIYACNIENNSVTKTFFQDTMERGNLFIYDNGIICSEGAGGAALHYYEFGKIGADGATYEKLESVLEEYTEGAETPVYKDAKTEEVLGYKSLDELMNKYVANAKKVEL